MGGIGRCDLGTGARTIPHADVAHQALEQFVTRSRTRRDERRAGRFHRTEQEGVHAVAEGGASRGRNHCARGVAIKVDADRRARLDEGDMRPHTCGNGQTRRLPRWVFPRGPISQGVVEHPAEEAQGEGVFLANQGSRRPRRLDPCLVREGAVVNRRVIRDADVIGRAVERPRPIVLHCHTRTVRAD